MVEEKKIRVFVLKPKGFNNSASSNRSQAIIKLVEHSFAITIIETKFKIRKKLINKILHGLIFRINLGISSFNVPSSASNNKNLIILFSIDTLTTLIVKLICWIKGNKLIIERNEFPAAIIDRNILRTALYKLFILSWQYKLYDGLFLMTDELICFYKKYTRPDCIIQKLPMMVDFNRFEITKTDKQANKYIAYCGSLSNEKDGVIFLIDAFKKISEEFSDINLKIAGGKHTEIERLRKLTEELNIGKRIEFLGLLDRDLIPSFLQNAMVLVLPRPNSLKARGGFPTKLGEYLATSKPVIVSRVGEIPYYLNEDEVFFIKPEEIEKDLIYSFKRIFYNYDEALDIGQRGKKKALKNFSLEANATKVANLITSVINKETDYE